MKRTTFVCAREKTLFILVLLWLLSTVIFLLKTNNPEPSTLEDAQPVPSTAVRTHLVLKSAGSHLPDETIWKAWKKILKDRKRPPDSTYNINISRSEEIPLRRTIKDTRPETCKDTSFNISSFPSASVIIPLYNEGLSLVLRTVHSVLDRTPDVLLKEIILVDDASSHEDLGEPLEQYVDELGEKVKLIRNFERQGLIRSRLHGMQLSRAPVIVFLDAHIEVNVQWLEPILAQLQEKPNSIIQPFVDGVDPDSLEYSAPNILYRGGLTWDLRYVWIRLAEHIQEAAFRSGQPYWTPTLIGCALAMDKAYFKSIGSFDADQLIWGGENVELSLRTWMCGGSLVTLPCSRVGHVFRPTPYKRETPFHSTWQKNLIRTAEVWLGPYKKYFYSATSIFENRHVNLTETEWKSLEKRKSLRDKLQCKSFDWFLREVSPDLHPPPRNSMQYGEITNERTQSCWQVLDDGYVSMDYMCWGHRVIVENTFTLTNDGLLMYGDKCVIYQFPLPTLRVQDCPHTPSPKHLGVWYMSYGERSVQWGQLKVDLTVNGKIKTSCISQVTSVVPPHNRTQMPQISSVCNEDDQFASWAFTYRFDSLLNSSHK